MLRYSVPTPRSKMMKCSGWRDGVQRIHSKTPLLPNFRADLVDNGDRANADRCGDGNPSMTETSRPRKNLTTETSKWYLSNAMILVVCASLVSQKVG